jgi:hypothetical protein
LGLPGTAATNRPIVPAPGDYDDGEIGGMIGRGNRSTRRTPGPVPLCPPKTPHVDQTRTRAAAVGSERLTASATAWPSLDSYSKSPSFMQTLSYISHVYVMNPCMFIQHVFTQTTYAQICTYFGWSRLVQVPHKTNTSISNTLTRFYCQMK